MTNQHDSPPRVNRCVLFGMLCIVLAIMASRAEAASPCIPGFDFGAFGQSYMNFGDGNLPVNDSWNSAAGTYAATQANGGCKLGTNGNPCQGGSQCVSTTITLPSVTVPTLGSNLGACASCAITPNNTYTTVSGTVTFTAGTYVIDTLTAMVKVPVGPVVIYVKTTLTPGWAQATPPNATLKPANLLFMGGPSLATLNLSNHGGYFAVYAPNTACTFQGSEAIFGSLVCKTVDSNPGPQALHYDAALSTATGGGFSCAPPVETSRAAPIVATINNQTAVVQGSFAAASGTQTQITTVASVATFAFPYITGHMRARLASTIGTAGTGYGSGTILFDAGATGKIPTVANTGCASMNGTCRNVFTITTSPGTTGVQFHPTKVQLNDSNASAIGALIAPTATVSGIGAAQWQTIVRTVLAGALGGVDRSTVAVIPFSSFAGVSTRPTIAYFGATDGMVHAVCASTGGTTASTANICPSLGTELWAFLPRTQLPLIRLNTARIDGSVRVVDVFGDFTNNPATGVRSWHTILTFQTGFALNSTPAAYAIDVTDPASPTVLWEYATPSTPSTLDLGTGLMVAANPAMIRGQVTNLAVLETSNGGSGGVGVVTTAVSQETGAKIWQFGYAYPSPPRGVAGDTSLLPTTGIVGGAVGVDLVGSGFVTDFVFGDLYGDLWRLDATDGTSRNGTNTPLFAFSTNKHPVGQVPTIYSSGGKQFAAIASGGYADPTATGWTTATQYVIGAKLSSTGATINETSAACASCALAVNTTLTSGDKSFSQVLVVGTQLFVTSDSADVNSSTYGDAVNTGHLMTVDLTGVAATTTVLLNSGASSLANSGSTLFSSSGTQQQQLVATATTTGASVDLSGLAKVTRRLWLRTQ